MSPVKHQFVARELRNRILSGRWHAGARMPTRLDLISSFRASAPTIQKALDELRRDGFVTPRGRAGTFVAERLPHVRRIGLAFPLEPSKTPPNHWSGLWRAIEAAAERLNAEGHWDFVRYYGVGQAGATDDARLASEIASHRLAALLQIGGPFRVLRRAELATLAETQAAFSALPPDQGVRVELQNCTERVAELVRQRGWGRIGIVASSLRRDAERVWRDALQRYELAYEPYLFSAIHPDSAAEARRVAYLMVGQERQRRPDVIVVDDDHLVEAVTQGVVDSQAGMPAHVEIVAHCNFPVPPPSQLPVTRVGPDLRRLIEAIKDLVADPTRTAWRGPIVVPCVFEQELVEEHSPSAFFAAWNSSR